MFDRFRDYITRNATSPLSEEHLALIQSALRPKSFRKKQYFLQEGEVCKNFGFIIKGATRQYTVDDKGVEHIVRLSLEDWWVGDRESWVSGTPSQYNIDMWEDTDMLLISRADMLRLIEEIPAYEEMVRKMDDRHSIAAQKRLNAAISLPADKRYNDFADNNPEILQRFPQHLIASYLGITKETLSRIRKQSLK